MSTPANLTQQQISQARLWRGKLGRNWTWIASQFGIDDVAAVRGAVSPAWAQKRKDQINAARSGCRNGAGETMSAFAERPDLPDHTTVTGRLMGDPIPGRSALDKLRAKQRSSDANPVV